MYAEREREREREREIDGWIGGPDLRAQPLREEEVAQGLPLLILSYSVCELLLLLVSVFTF